MFFNCKDISSETASECSEVNKKENSISKEQTGIKYHRVPIHRRNKDKSKSKKPKVHLMNIRSTGMLSERKNTPHSSVRDNTQWPQLKSLSTSQKDHGDTKSESSFSETQTDVLNTAEVHPLWTQMRDNVPFLRQSITRGTQTEGTSINIESHSERLAYLASILSLAQFHKTYADVVQQENGRTEQETKPMNSETSSELKAFLKLKDIKTLCMHKHSQDSLEASLQKLKIHNTSDDNETDSIAVDITEVQISRTDKDQVGDPQSFKDLLLMLIGQNRGLKINILHENQLSMLNFLISVKHMIPETSSLSASRRNYFILHSDSCMLNCSIVNQLRYRYSFQEGTLNQIKLYNQSLQKKNIATLTITDNELRELSCHKLRTTASNHCQEKNKSEDQRLQQNGDINKDCAPTEEAQIDENMQHHYINTMVTDTTERQSTLQENMYANPEDIATGGLDPIFAFYVGLELWGGAQPRMPYTKMFGTHSLQNKSVGMPGREKMHGEEDKYSVPKWLIVPLKKEHQFILDAVKEEQSDTCAVYYASQTCKSSRYIVEIENKNFK